MSIKYTQDHEWIKLNVPINYTAAYTVFGLRCIIGNRIPNNAGSLEPFAVSAPPGTILSAGRPAPVAMRHILGHFTSDLVLGCLHQAVPGSVPADWASAWAWDFEVWQLAARGESSEGTARARPAWSSSAVADTWGKSWFVEPLNTHRAGSHRRSSDSGHSWSIPRIHTRTGSRIRLHNHRCRSHPSPRTGSSERSDSGTIFS